MDLYKKLFFSPSFFTIAIRRKPEQSILNNAEFKADYVIPASRLHWSADPIIVEDKGKTYLFYEAFHKIRGRLEVCEIYDNCTLSKPVVIMDDECHYSYPFVFKEKDQWYMIPESSQRNEVCLYSAVEFPYKWKKISILLKEKAVDTTVFSKNGKLFLLTYLIKTGSERVVPQAYTMDFKGKDTVLRKIKWDDYDEFKCRGAGQLFVDSDNLIRPAQVSREDNYGDQVVFYKIHCDNEKYQEKICGELKPENVIAKKWWLDGLHTYTGSNKFEAIDIRCRKFDLFKVPRTILSKAFKH